MVRACMEGVAFALRHNLETAEKAVASRLDAQKTNFDGYGTNQIDLLGHAITKKVGPYYFYAVSEHASTWEEVFMGLVK